MKKSLEASPETERFGNLNALAEIPVPLASPETRAKSPRLSRPHPGGGGVMADRSILFSGAMIRALLAGTKTQTRRIVSGVPDQPVANCHPMNTPRHPAPYLDSYCGQPKTAANPRGMSNEWMWWQVDDRPGYPSFKVKFVPGDRLWVREAHYLTDDGHNEFAVYAADEAAVREHNKTMERIAGQIDEKVWRRHVKLRPSIHMPRWASRLTLTVTEVRVQRLQDISEEDAIAEGYPPAEHRATSGIAEIRDAYPIAWYAWLWDSINGAGSWDANPWVAAYSFKIEHRNIDAEVRHDL